MAEETGNAVNEEASDDLGAEGHVINMAGQHCANDECECEPTIGANGAYLHRDRDRGKLVIFCPGCSLLVRLDHSLRFPLVAL